ncbi:ribosome biogenesis protein Noc4 [Lentinula aciculospora]|uniref:Ribosome biogenesis protein Noc4 n=1 Tax=Lentinula aciculospora TaxID=153920 RepID=A0A9W8ZZ88_9AGAR|nr:ribosome biogenesis protein Noc4 [Lentinula aciculospora]
MPIRSLPSPSSTERPSKKRKLLTISSIQSSASSQKSQSSQSKTIVALESQLAAAVIATANSETTSLNPLADLFSIASNPKISAQDTSKAIWALYRVWVGIAGSGRLSTMNSTTSAGSTGEKDAKVVKAWLWDRLNEYVELLCGLLKDEEKVLRTSALQILFSLQKHLSTSVSVSVSGNPQFHISHFKKIVNALVLCPVSHRIVRSNGKLKGVEGDGEEEKDSLVDTDVVELFHSTWLSVYDDVRWFFLREVGALLSKLDQKTIQAHPNAPTNALSILEKLASTSSWFPTFPERLTKEGKWWVEEMGQKPMKVKKNKISKSKSNLEGIVDGEDTDDDEEDSDKDAISEEDDDWRKFFDEQDKKSPKSSRNAGIKGRQHQLTLHQSLHNLSSHRAVFTHAWLGLLPKLNVPGDISTNNAGSGKDLAVRALNVMHRGVLPYLTRPVLVMDWVGACVDYGGTPGLLALNALYVLMKEYNLDYPSFYTRLYAFLDRDLLHLKHRARFFRLAEVFLGSSHLPLTLLASFIKRLSLLSLSAPPSAIVIVIPFVWNLMRRHPGLMVMIHRELSEEGGLYEDPFLPTHPNPLLTNALSSSLFELHAHVSHYHAPVSSMAKVFEGVFTKDEYKMEDFLDHGYGSLFDAEANRKIKKEPALNMDMELMLGKKQKVELFSSASRDSGADGDEAGSDPSKDEMGFMNVGVGGVGVAGDLVNELWVF